MIVDNKILNISNRVNKIFSDLVIYSIGVFGTRILTFLLVPLYTYFIEKPADYGYYDLCLTLCMMLLPVSTLQLREGSFRFLFSTDDDNERRQVISFIYRSVLTNIGVILAIALLVDLFFTVAYWWYAVAMLLAMTLHEIFAQTVRGLKDNKTYVFSSLINVFCVGIFSVLFVVILDLGIRGIFLANIFSRIITVIFIEIRRHTISRFFSITLNTKGVSRNILKYTLPLIPISVCWYLTISCDRLFINSFIGLETGGIYAVAVRFTTILQTLSLIFYQSWQETAISQYDSDDRSQFFSKVFNLYAYVLVALFVIYAFGLKLNYGWLISDEYSHSLTYLYPMGLAAALNALATSYFDLLYQCAKETKRAASAVFISLGINLTCNYIFINLMGVWGVILTSLITYGFLLVYRIFDTKRYFTLSISPSLIIPVLLVIACAVPFYMNTYIWVDIVVLIAALAIIVWSMPRTYTQYLVQNVSRKFKKK